MKVSGVLGWKWNRQVVLLWAFATMCALTFAKWCPGIGLKTLSIGSEEDECGRAGKRKQAGFVLTEPSRKKKQSTLVKGECGRMSGLSDFICHRVYNCVFGCCSHLH